MQWENRDRKNNNNNNKKKVLKDETFISFFFCLAVRKDLRHAGSLFGVASEADPYLGWPMKNFVCRACPYVILSRTFITRECTEDFKEDSASLCSLIISAESTA